MTQPIPTSAALAATVSPASPRHVPFTVTAHLQQGVALDVLFGTALDGLLASAVRDRAKVAAAAHGRYLTGSMLDGGLDADQPAVVPLPLGVCAASPVTDQAHATDPDWHWLCTTAYPVDLTGHRTTGDPDVHHQHSRIREATLAHVADALPASLPPASGRYRLRRMPVVTTPAAAVQWQGIGDPDAVCDLLSAIPAIGRRRGTGEGLVLRWNVTPHDTLPAGQWLRFGHCHPDGTLGRPIPHACLDRAGLSADRQGVAGIRPPYWHPATQRNVLLPAPL